MGNLREEGPTQEIYDVKGHWESEEPQVLGKQFRVRLQSNDPDQAPDYVTYNLQEASNFAPLCLSFLI